MTLACALTSCNTRAPDRFQVSDGYVGWLVVQYQNPACQPLPMESGYNVFRFSGDGRLCTSSRQPEGEAFDRFEYVKGDGALQEIDQRTMVWGGVASSSHRSFVFVGNEQQFRARTDSAEQLDQRCTTDLHC